MLRNEEDTDIVLFTDDERALVVHTSLLMPKPTRNTQGAAAASLRGKKRIIDLRFLAESGLKEPIRYRARAIPRAPVSIKLEDRGEEQLTLL